MRLATATKVRVAGVLYRAVRLGRRLLGRPPDTVVCTRGGIVWALNVQDGIQLSIYLFGAFERATARTLARLLPSGGVAIDVGANVGAHTLPMARHVGTAGRVIALEPTALARESLRRNLGLNPALGRTVTVHAAALVAPGEPLSSEYYSSWPVSHAERRHAIHRGVPNDTSGSIAITLDELVTREVISRLDVVKVDVDGREVRVLRGAVATLLTLRPSLVLELAPYALSEHGDSLHDLLSLVRQAQYRLVDGQSFAPICSDADTLVRMIPAGGSINIVALPVERPVAEVVPLRFKSTRV
jgi:FkbM family methyltransferase